MKLSLQLKLGQQLTMTPQLQQAIRLLQLSTLDLQQEIHQALESNPMLELIENIDEEEPDFTAENSQQKLDKPDHEVLNDVATDVQENGSPNSEEATWQEQIPTDLSVEPTRLMGDFRLALGLWCTHFAVLIKKEDPHCPAVVTTRCILKCTDRKCSFCRSTSPQISQPGDSIPEIHASTCDSRLALPRHDGSGARAMAGPRVVAYRPYPRSLRAMVNGVRPPSRHLEVVISIDLFVRVDGRIWKRLERVSCAS